MIAKINLNKNFIVYGLGISGVSVAQKLFDYGFEVIATDDNPQSISKFSEKFPKIPTKQSSEIVLNSDSVVVFAPGIPLYFPKRHRILEAVEKAKVDLVCDIELFFRFYSEPVQNLYLQRPSEQNSQTSDARCMPLYQSSFCASGFENAAHLTCRSEILNGFSGNQNHFSAITGTNGKSTTTALSGFIFQ
jgi:UDP-N-acetylmuramoylalanine-D-glutamate ligase